MKKPLPAGWTDEMKAYYDDYKYFVLSKGNNRFYVHAVERAERVMPAETRAIVEREFIARTKFKNPLNKHDREWVEVMMAKFIEDLPKNTLAELEANYRIYQSPPAHLRDIDPDLWLKAGVALAAELHRRGLRLKNPGPLGYNARRRSEKERARLSALQEREMLEYRRKRQGSLPRLRRNPSSKWLGKIRLTSGQFGWDYMIRKVFTDGSEGTSEEDTVLIQTDYDYPGVAQTFGWAGAKSYVPGKINSSEIQAAGEWLSDNVGAEAEDPGYFTNDNPRRKGLHKNPGGSRGSAGTGARPAVRVGRQVTALEYLDEEKAKAENLRNPGTPWRHDYKNNSGAGVFGVDNGAVVIAPKGTSVVNLPDGSALIKGKAKTKLWGYR